MQLRRTSSYFQKVRPIIWWHSQVIMMKPFQYLRLKEIFNYSYTVVPAPKDPLIWNRLVLCDRPLSAPISIFCTFCTPISDCTPKRDHPVTAERAVFRRRDHCISKNSYVQLSETTSRFITTTLLQLLEGIQRLGTKIKKINNLPDMNLNIFVHRLDL